MKKSNGQLILGIPLSRGLREGGLLLAGAVALYLLLSLISYDSSDPGWSRTGASDRVVNTGGVVGAWLSDVFLFLFGYWAYLIPVMVGYAAWSLYRGHYQGAHHGREWIVRIVGLLCILGTGTGLVTLYAINPRHLPLSGGVLGDVVANGLVQAFNAVGAALFLIALFLAGITLFTGLSWIRVADTVGRWVLIWAHWSGSHWAAWRTRRTAGKKIAPVKSADETGRTPPMAEESRRSKERSTPRIGAPVKTLEASPRVVKERQIPLFKGPAQGGLPLLSLLDVAQPSSHRISHDSLEHMSRSVEAKLADFGIEVQVVAVHPGPVITRFELQPAAGVKVSQISNLAKDLARSLSTISVRIVDVIPGKSVIGLEVPNEQREMVRLGELLTSRQYDEAESPLSLALGKDIGGHPVIVDLQRMPHLLVAGTTGSGKSVGINAMILSILYKAAPQDVRLILIDPKMLELSVYQGIAHLLAPVVTDMKEAANALRWCVAEMDRRYRLMASLGVRNVAGYNRKVQEAAEAGQPLPDLLVQVEEGQPRPSLGHLPYIVVVIDELADMMMVVGKKVEELIARLAQKARASGIHLVLATQRPSVDVITGLIKANIPTRIAFQVSSRIDSRTILDQMGAEQLLGHGDMLYLAPGTGIPVRVHGAFIADHEVHKVVDYLKQQQGQPEYVEEVLNGEAAEGNVADYMSEGVDDAENDPLYDQAVRVVVASRRASVSGVQRRLKVGYNRAARLVEQMERAGIVGPLQSNGVREVLVPTSEEQT